MKWIGCSLKLMKLDNVQLVCSMTYEEYNYMSNEHENTITER